MPSGSVARGVIAELGQPPRSGITSLAWQK